MNESYKDFGKKKIRLLFWDFGEYLKNMKIFREYLNFGEYLKIVEEYFVKDW
jgi:hypothetical protein